MLTAIAAWALALGITPPSSARLDWREIVGYYRCEGAAQTAGLGADEFAACAALYARVKLGHIGLDEAAFHALPRHERVEANRRAFRAMRAWEAANPALVERLKALGAR